MSAPTPYAPLPAPAPDTPPRHQVDPAHRLDASPRSRRGWRTAVTMIAALFVSLVLLALGAVSMTSWAVQRSYQDVAATYELGTPDSLSLTTHVADVRVASSSEVDQVTLALVEDGSTDVPDAGETVRARVDVTGDATRRSIKVSQPGMNRFGSLLDEHREVLLLVPSDHVMDLEMRADVGRIDASGTFASLEVSADVGDVRLSGVEAPGGIAVHTETGEMSLAPAGPVPGGITVTSTLGDVDVTLPPDAAGDVSVRGEVGEVQVTAPGTGRRVVQATSDVGTVSVDPAFMTAGGDVIGRIDVTTSLGDVSVTR